VRLSQRTTLLPLNSKTRRLGDLETWRLGDLDVYMLRNYDCAEEAVKDNYRKMRSRQTIDFIQRVKSKYNNLSTPMTIWQAADSLKDFVDISDPDVDLPNIIHMYQTAEGIRQSGGAEWLQLTGFIHDLGKCIYLRGCDEDGTTLSEQWGIVGDTFIVGEPLSKELVYPEFNTLNEDHSLSIYTDGCGLKTVNIAYGHDEYLYQVLSQYQGCKLPLDALNIIRYHSLYPWHKAGCYTRLESTEDQATKDVVKNFNHYDLYTKSNTTYTTDQLSELRTYYDTLIQKYLPGTLLW
jgi:inositol oxygenase